MHVYEYIQHPCITLHLTGRAPKPVKVNDGRVGLNGKIGLAITTLVGTMVCGYVFAIIALVSLPSVLGHLIAAVGGNPGGVSAAVIPGAAGGVGTHGGPTEAPGPRA
jgi:hypothetical protein